MRDLLKTLAGLRLTLVGLAGLAATCIAIALVPERAIPWLTLPLGVLAINLAAAIMVRHVFRRQSALLLFHVGLLVILVIVGVSVLIQFDGQIEMVEGAAFDRREVSVQKSGCLHPNRIDRVGFTQGPIEIRYLPGLRRDTTSSRVAVPGPSGRETLLVIGDRRGFLSSGYRFMTTPNKGFALLLDWQDETGQQVLGAIHFPSYPEFEWKQVNTWTTPAGETIRLELDLADRVSDDVSWVLQSKGVEFSVVVQSANGARHRLRAGEALHLDGGRITPVGLRLWMGYRITYDPLLPWLLAAAFLTLAAMAAHFATKFRVPRAAAARGDSVAVDGQAA